MILFKKNNLLKFIILLFFLFLAACTVGEVNPNLLPCGRGKTCQQNFECRYIQELHGYFCLKKEESSPSKQPDAASNLPEIIFLSDTIVDISPQKEEKPSPEQSFFCGDNICQLTEDCANCPQDCPCKASEICNAGRCVPSGPSCGNQKCEQNEDCANCPQDCSCLPGTICKEGKCLPAETICGNLQCEQNEDCANCPQDCPCKAGEICQGGRCTSCGNGRCDIQQGENCASCAQDCPCKAGEICKPSGTCIPICKPNCQNKECGSDGCGGSCGSCRYSCTSRGRCMRTIKLISLTVQCFLGCPMDAQFSVQLKTTNNQLWKSEKLFGKCNKKIIFKKWPSSRTIEPQYITKAKITVSSRDTFEGTTQTCGVWTKDISQAKIYTLKNKNKSATLIFEVQK